MRTVEYLSVQIKYASFHSQQTFQLLVVIKVCQNVPPGQQSNLPQLVKTFGTSAAM